MRLSLSLYLSLFRMIADNLPREPLSQEDGELPLDSQQLDHPVMEALRMRNSLQEDGELPSLSQQLDPPVIEALRMRDVMKAQYALALEGIDALLTPTTMTTAIPLDEVDQSKAPAHYTRFGNYLNLCNIKCWV